MKGVQVCCLIAGADTLDVYKNESSTHCIGRDGLEPVIIQVEQHHLRLCGLQDEVSKLLHLQASLEGQLQLRAFDHNVGEVKQVDLHKNKTRYTLNKK